MCLCPHASTCGSLHWTCSHQQQQTATSTGTFARGPHLFARGISARGLDIPCNRRADMATSHSMERRPAWNNPINQVSLCLLWLFVRPQQPPTPPHHHHHLTYGLFLKGSDNRSPPPPPLTHRCCPQVPSGCRGGPGALCVSCEGCSVGARTQLWRGLHPRDTAGTGAAGGGVPL